MMATKRDWADDRADELVSLVLENDLPFHRLSDVVAAKLRRPPLWCCHVRGPNDVHAAPDYDTALAWSDMLNDRFFKRPEERHEYDPIIRAAPAIWPWSAEAHAEDLPRSIAGFATPKAA